MKYYNYIYVSIIFICKSSEHEINFKLSHVKDKLLTIFPWGSILDIFLSENRSNIKTWPILLPIARYRVFLLLIILIITYDIEVANIS